MGDMCDVLRAGERLDYLILRKKVGTHFKIVEK